jgi:hypothetical protein
MLETRTSECVLGAPLDEEVLWDIKGLMKYLHVSSWKARECYRHEGLPYIDIGGVYRFRPEAVKAWARAREQCRAALN